MRVSSLSLVWACLLFVFAPGGAALGAPKMTINGIQADTKAVGGNDVTINVTNGKMAYGPVLIVHVTVAGAKVRYDEITIEASNQLGKKITIAPALDNATVYGSANPGGGSFGFYMLRVEDGERLAKVKVTRGGESGEFDVLLPVP